MEELTCLQCGYSLRGLSDSKACPECGTEISDSIFANGNAALFRYENRRLGRARDYRVNRKGAYVFAIMSVIWLMLSMGLIGRLGTDDETLAASVSALASAIVWFVIGLANHFRLKHVQSIEHYRALVRSLVESGALSSPMAETGRTSPRLDPAAPRSATDPSTSGRR